MSAASDLLAALVGRGISVVAVGEYLEVWPASGLSEEDCAAIRAHKLALLDLLAPARVCYVCGGTTWWQLPAGVGGDWRCARCHPDPRSWQGQEGER